MFGRNYVFVRDINVYSVSLCSIHVLIAARKRDPAISNSPRVYMTFSNSGLVMGIGVLLFCLGA